MQDISTLPSDEVERPSAGCRLARWYRQRIAPDEPSRAEMVSYAVGGTGVSLGELTLGLFHTQIWVMNVGLDPRTLGIISALKTFWDGINDTLFGHITDNWRGRWGRRRPFIAIGGILYGLMLMGNWWFDPSWTTKHLLIWYTVALFLVEGAQTIHAVPYYAMGLEISPSYSGRTRVMTYRDVVHRLVAFSAPWFKPIALAAALGGILNGARVVCGALGLFVMITSLYSAWTCRERIRLSRGRAREPFLKAVRGVGQNRHFWRLVIIYVLLIGTTTLFNQFMLYLTVGYVFGGDQVREAIFAAVLSLLTNTTVLVGLPVAAWISRKLGKHRALAILVGSLMTGSLLKLVCIDPERPYLIAVTLLLSAFSMKGALMLLVSMQADVVDVDESYSGRRREGLFAGVQGAVSKVSVSLAVAMTGFAIAASGYQTHLKLAQDVATFERMRAVAACAPAVCLLPALFLLWKYPLTQERMGEVRAALAQRRAASGQEP